MWSRLVLALTLLAAPVTSADKGTKMAVVFGYMRASRGLPPPHGKKTAKFLTDALWEPIYAKPKDRTIVAPAKLRFVEQVGEASPSGVRTVRLKRVAKLRGVTVIEIDNEVFGLAPCKDRKTTACLMPRPELSFPDDDGFAKTP